MMRRWRRLVIVGGEVGAAEAAWFLLVVFVTLVSSVEGKCRTRQEKIFLGDSKQCISCKEYQRFVLFATAYGLKCYVGLGNTSELKKQKVVECPEEKHYVCMKMYGGGMGDQVRRKCHLINSVSSSFSFFKTGNIL